MASVSTHITQPELEHGRCQVPLSPLELPGLLSCLVISWSEKRSAIIELAAKDESWQVAVRNDVQDFLRSVFELGTPLTIVDLPQVGSSVYEEMRHLTANVSELNRSLLLVCGADSNVDEELWVRQLGVWAYLPGAGEPAGLKHILAEARKAVARQSLVAAEAFGHC